MELALSSSEWLRGVISMNTTINSNEQTHSPIRIHYEIERLLAFSLEQGLIDPLDVIPTRNALYDLFQITKPVIPTLTEQIPQSAVPILENLLDYAADCGLLSH